jgi:hypothetical protein
MESRGKSLEDRMLDSNVNPKFKLCNGEILSLEYLSAIIRCAVIAVGAYGQCQEYSCRGPGHALRIYRRHLSSWITADDSALLRISGSLERACSML